MEELLKMINLKFGNITELLQMNKKTMTFDSSLISKNDNINIIIDLYIECMKKQETKRIIIIEDKVWFDYITKFTNINIDKLFQLSTILERIEEKCQKEFKDKIISAIENTFKNDIEKKKLKNISMLEYVINKIKINQSIIQNNFSTFELHSYIDLSKINKQFIEKYKESNINQYFHSINDQIKKLITDANNLNELFNVILLFSEKINENFYIFKENLAEKFSGLLKKEDKNYSSKQFCKIYLEMFKLIPSFSSIIIKELEDNISEQNVINIYLYFLNKEINDQNIKNKKIEYLGKKQFLQWKQLLIFSQKYQRIKIKRRY